MKYMETFLIVDKCLRLLRRVRPCLIHDHNEMPSLVVSEHLPQELNDFIRCNPFSVQTEQKMPLPADSRHGCYAASFASNTLLWSFSSRRPGFAQEGRQRDIGFVLKIRNSPVFFDGLADLGNFLPHPFFSSLFVDFVVFAFRLLVSQACFAKSSPDGVLRYRDFIFLFDDGTQAPHRPEVGFITELGSRVENQFLKFFFVKFLQQARSPAARSTLQAICAFGIIASHPSKNSRAVRSIRSCNLSNRHTVTNGFYRTKSNLIVGIVFLAHGEELVLLYCVHVNVNVADLLR